MVIAKVFLSVYSTDGTVKERHRSRVEIQEDDDFIKLKNKIVTFLGIRYVVESLGISSYNMKPVRQLSVRQL